MNAQPYAEANDWRKRVIGCIAGHFKKEGRYQELSYTDRLEKIKGTATRIAQCEYFNAIPIEKLRSIYNTFKNKQ